MNSDEILSILFVLFILPSLSVITDIRSIEKRRAIR